jgi:multidrug resistance efflux pump
VEGEIIFLVEDGQKVSEGDVLCVLEDPYVKNDYEELLMNVETEKAELNKLKADLNKQNAIMEAQIKTILAQTAIANLDSVQLAFSSPVQRRLTELQLKQAAIEKNKLERTMSFNKEINDQQLKAQQMTIKRLENRLAQAKEQLEKLTIWAPQAGLAIRSTSPMTGSKWREGDQVWPGLPIVQIPAMDSMKVHMEVAETEYKRIETADSVVYQFDAMPGNWAIGRITVKAPMGRSIKGSSSVKVYDVEGSVEKYRQLPDPGYTASCRVIINRLADTLVIPQIAVFEEDSATRYVNVTAEERFEKRKSITGLLP